MYKVCHYYSQKRIIPNFSVRWRWSVVQMIEINTELNWQLRNLNFLTYLHTKVHGEKLIGKTRFAINCFYFYNFNLFI